MAVADTTIWAPRASYVDFSLPYSESGVVLVVKNSKPLNMWIFTKPLRWDLWLRILAASVLMGIAICTLERLKPAPARAQQDEEPNAALVGRKTSLFVLVCWLFTAFVLMQSYTANLSAILTLDQLQFSFSEDHYIGYHQGSFTKEFLTEKLHISPTRLRSYSSIKEYHDAMRKGSKKGGIDAIFDELPYMKLLLNRYYSQYTIVGPTYRTDGLGFAFAIGSTLVAHFSRAILNVTQGLEMTGLEQKHFGPGYSSQDPLLNAVSQGASSLTFYDFAGLFLILGALTLSAFLGAVTGTFDKLRKIKRDVINWRNGTYAPFANGGDEAAVGVGEVNRDPANAEIEVAADGGGDVNRDPANADPANAEIEVAAVGGGEVNRDPANAEIEVAGREQNNQGPR